MHTTHYTSECQTGHRRSSKSDKAFLICIKPGLIMDRYSSSWFSPRHTFSQPFMLCFQGLFYFRTFKVFFALRERTRDRTSLLGHQGTLSSSFCSPGQTACCESFCESFSGSSLHTNERTETTHTSNFTPCCCCPPPPIKQHQT